jgi:hypothetical protein
MKFLFHILCLKEVQYHYLYDIFFLPKQCVKLNLEVSYRPISILHIPHCTGIIYLSRKQMLSKKANSLFYLDQNFINKIS